MSINRGCIKGGVHYVLHAHHESLLYCSYSSLFVSLHLNWHWTPRPVSEVNNSLESKEDFCCIQATVNLNKCSPDFISMVVDFLVFVLMCKKDANERVFYESRLADKLDRVRILINVFNTQKLYNHVQAYRIRRHGPTFFLTCQLTKKLLVKKLLNL